MSTQHTAAIRLRFQNGTLTANWSQASAARFPLPLFAGDSVKIGLLESERLSEAVITAVTTSTGGAVDISALPAAEVTLTDANRGGSEETYRFSVAGTARFGGEVLSWNADPDLILRTGMQGGM